MRARLTSFLVLAIRTGSRKLLTFEHDRGFFSRARLHEELLLGAIAEFGRDLRCGREAGSSGARNCRLFGIQR